METTTHTARSAAPTKHRQPWISPLLLRSAETWRPYPNDQLLVCGPGSYVIDQRNAIGANSKAGFTFTKSKLYRDDRSTNKKYLVHADQCWLSIAQASVNAYTSANIYGVGAEAEFPWRGKDQVNKYPSSPRATFGFSPRFKDPIPSTYILDGRHRPSTR
jgi:hypothetical protein